MTAVLTVAGANISGTTHFDVEVEVGRDNVDSQPDASVLTAILDGWQAAGKVSDPLVLSDSWGQLFAGTITDLQAELDPTRTHPWRTRITAAGPLADIGRAIVGDEPWPQESDSKRVKRILDLVGVNTAAIHDGVIGPAILAKDVDRQSALDQAQNVAADAFGVLWEQPADPDHPIRYSPQRLRTWTPVALGWAELPTTTWGAVDSALTWNDIDSDAFQLPGSPVALTLNAGDVIADLVLEQRIGDLIRTVRVTYGAETEDGDGNSIPRPQAIAGNGTPEVGRDTQLANAIDAAALADTLWRSHREPAWLMRQIILKPLEDMAPAVAADIRAALTVGTRLTIDRIAYPGPFGSVWQGYLEGWTHQLTPGRHVVEMFTSERIFTEPSDRWQDIGSGLRWADVVVTWDQTGDMP